MPIVKTHDLPAIALIGGAKLELFVAETHLGHAIVEVHAPEQTIEERLTVSCIPSDVTDREWEELGALLRERDPALFARIYLALVENADDFEAAREQLDRIVAEVQ